MQHNPNQTAVYLISCDPKLDQIMGSHVIQRIGWKFSLGKNVHWKKGPKSQCPRWEIVPSRRSSARQFHPREIVISKK